MGAGNFRLSAMTRAARAGASAKPASFSMATTCAWYSVRSAAMDGDAAR